MSMSIALSANASMTLWYASASASGVAQFGPSLLPLHPPNDGTTSPPAARIALIVCWSTPPSSGRWLSHDGVQPPPESTNASVNHRTPVLLMTDVALCGLPHPRYRYGAPR